MTPLEKSIAIKKKKQSDKEKLLLLIGISARDAKNNTLFDYLETYGDKSFDETPFNEVDGLLLSRLTYLPFEAITQNLNSESFSPTDAANVFASIWEKGGFSSKDYHSFIAQAVNHRHVSPSLLEKAKVNPFFVTHGWLEDHALLSYLGNKKFSRFADLRFFSFVCELEHEKGKQFAAITYSFPDFLFVAFRGTDDTLTGWKEDLNMVFLSPIPAQECALYYFLDAAASFNGDILVGGHSKGGNLAMYAATFCGQTLQNRIKTIYNFDGPGFNFEACITSKPEYQNIQPKIKNFVPQMSIVGLLLDITDNYTVIKSNCRAMFFQHDVYSWAIKDNSFELYEHINPQNLLIRDILTAWINTLNAERRKEFISVLDILLDGTNMLTFPEMAVNWKDAVMGAFSAWSRLEPQTKKYFISMCRVFLHMASAEAVLVAVKDWLERVPIEPQERESMLEKMRKKFFWLLVVSPLWDFLSHSI